MAAGIVYSNYTTAAGVTFLVGRWVPDTSAPLVNAIPIHALVKTDGTPLDFGVGSGGSATQRMIIDGSQIGQSQNTPFITSVGVVPVGFPTDQSPLATKDAGPNWTSVWGVSGVPVVTATNFSTTAVTDAPTSTQKLCIDDIIVSTDAVTKLTLLEETSGTVMFGPWFLPANSGPIQISLRGKKKLATADKKLVATSVGAANMTIQVGYHSE